VQHDATANALYLHIGDASKPKKVEASVRVHPGVIVDVDKDGTLLGIEVILPNTPNATPAASPLANLRLPTAAEARRLSKS
jgi:uncharacterized protein YuzE